MVLVLLASFSVFSHPLDVIYFKLDAISESSFVSCLNIHPDVLKKITNLQSMTKENLADVDLFSLKINNQDCKNKITETIILPNDAKLCHEIICVPELGNSFSLKFGLLDQLDSSFSVIGQYNNGRDGSAFTLNKNLNQFVLASQKTNFFQLGIEHIGAAPSAWISSTKDFQLPDGIDHILFIVVLVLMSLTWKSLLLNISGFTLGHSITIGLSLGGIILIPAAYIEPAIAASIAYLAFQVFLGKAKNNQLLLTLFFGFIHGMGFSYILNGLELNDITQFLKVLFLFNLGIEAGQLIIVSALLPLYFYVNKNKVSGKYIKQTIGTIVLGFSVYWCYERLIILF